MCGCGSGVDATTQLVAQSRRVRATADRLDPAGGGGIQRPMAGQHVEMSLEPPPGGGCGLGVGEEVVAAAPRGGGAVAPRGGGLGVGEHVTAAASLGGGGLRGAHRGGEACGGSATGEGGGSGLVEEVRDRKKKISGGSGVIGGGSGVDPDRMDKILERYERYSYAEKVLISAESETQVKFVSGQHDIVLTSAAIASILRFHGNWCHEYRKLKAKVETIQKCQKHLMGEDLESLNLKELQQLEQQLENSLKHIRSRKSQLMLESISELQKKEKSLQEENKVLQKELVEKQKVIRKQQVQWDQTHPQTSSSSSSFMMREALPTANISNYPAAAGERAEDAAVQPQVRMGLPPWMVSHING
uniref:MADs14 protein n=1 Tax=Phyllostachys edulis TaxID=38705 RepID=A0A1D8F0I8_PHYED|nr:MADs14 protein [Phyllostachys edulis]